MSRALCSLLHLLCLHLFRALAHGHDDDTTTIQYAPTTIQYHAPTTTNIITLTTNPPWPVSVDSTGLCPSRTVNYITHTLARQCLRTDRVLLLNGSVSSYRYASITLDVKDAIPVESAVAIIAAPSTTTDVSAAATVTSPPSADATPLAVVEDDSDSPLDNVNFLSFEDWKKQNLAKSGQSPEDIGHSQQVKSHRPRPINNALETLGDEQEIDIDFTGFGGAAQAPPAGQAATTSNSAHSAPHTGNTGSLRSKDAGKTCKERTNYASFDCAATILKTNKECKSASSVLVENKDSYMLNKCSADNKFLIVELCNDIQIDTIVLANYEFFSSGFRHFRISVSDRYPVKMEKWRDLGTFEARNTREIQAFLVDNPQIWARYLRIEFLTHYGTEYYCPVSLLRVHGITMMEDYRHQEELARGELDDITVEPEVLATPEVVQTPAESTEEGVQAIAEAIASVEDAKPESVPGQAESGSETPDSAVEEHESNGTVPTGLETEFTVIHYSNGSVSVPTNVGANDPNNSNTDTSTVNESETAMATTTCTETENDTIAAIQSQATSTNQHASDSNSTSSSTSASVESVVAAVTTRSGNSSMTPSSSSKAPPGTLSTNADGTSSTAGSSIANGTSSATGNQTAPPADSTRAAPTVVGSPPPQPSTQESFFKSVTKRLLALETNSTLSLQYIEEQSRILREAFGKVEKRQVSTTNKFLTQLNDTVMLELHGFRQAYDQLWQSTVIELEGQRETYQREMLALSTRLTMVADELVWQKRMGIIQSTLLLLCLALVLFGRNGGGGPLEMPLMHQMLNKSRTALQGHWDRDSPVDGSQSPEGRSPVSLFRKRIWRSHTEPPPPLKYASDSDHRPGTADGGDAGISIGVEPPSPPDVALRDGDDALSHGSDWDDDGLDSRPISPEMDRSSLPSSASSPVREKRSGQEQRELHGDADLVDGERSPEEGARRREPQTEAAGRFSPDDGIQ